MADYHAPVVVSAMRRMPGTLYRGTMMTPYWTSHDGQHVLYCGDCLAVLPTLGTVDAVVTDPPYGVGLGGTTGTGGAHGLLRESYSSYDDTYENFITTVLPGLNMAINIATRAAVFTGPHIHEQKKPDALGGVYSAAASGRHCWGYKNFLPVLLYGTAPDLHKGAKIPSAIASNAIAEPSGHPCPKPLAWMLWLVRLASRTAQIVCDPFAGSGTTGVACIRTGRRFIGIEIDEQYCAIAVRRLETELSQPQLFPISRITQPTQEALL